MHAENLHHRLGDPTCGRGVLPRDETIGDDPQGLIAMARAGLGLCQIYRFMVRDALKDGSLVEVLERHAGRTRPFSVVYPKAPLAPHVRVVVEWILARKLAA